MRCFLPPQSDGHHEYHMDGGHETRGEPRRVLAMLFYLNNVTEGGETAFLAQVRVSVARGLRWQRDWR